MSTLRLSAVFFTRSFRNPITFAFIIIMPPVFMFSMLHGKEQAFGSHTAFLQDGVYPLLAGMSLMMIILLTLVSNPAILISAKRSHLLKSIRYSRIGIGTFFASTYLMSLCAALFGTMLMLISAQLIVNVQMTLSMIVSIFGTMIAVHACFFVFGNIIGNYCHTTEQVNSVMLPLYMGVLILSGSFFPFTHLTGTLHTVLTQYNPFYYLHFLLQANTPLATKILTPEFLVFTMVTAGGTLFLVKTAKDLA